LIADFIVRGLVGQLGNELIGLDVYVLLAWHGFWSLNISGKELFGCLSPTLLDLFGVV
jgi:hypothetical protein